MWRRYLLCGLTGWIAAAMPACAFVAYVSNEKSNTVTVIDTDKWVVTGTIKVGQRPRGIGFALDGKSVMVAVGGNWPGAPDATTQFPQQMMVDYVRVSGS